MADYTASASERNTVRKHYNITPDEISTRVANLKAWATTHPDLLTYYHDEYFLEIMLLRAHFEIEKTQKRMLSYYHNIPKYPEIFGNLGKGRAADEAGCAIVSPKLLENCERLSFVKFVAYKEHKVNMERFLVTALSTGMLVFSTDYVVGTRFVVDFENCTMWHMVKLKLSFLLKLMAIHAKVAKITITGIELLNTSTLMSAVVSLAKMILTPKLFSRITVHSDLNSLYKTVGKEYLPSDYGGDLGSLEELTVEWDAVILANKHVYEVMADIAEKKDASSSSKETIAVSR